MIPEYVPRVGNHHKKALHPMAQKLEASLITDVAQALASDDTIELRPTSFRLSDEARTAAGRSTHYADLLRCDPALFLERYGRHLSDRHFALIAGAAEELGDYEIQFHVAKVREHRAISALHSASKPSTSKTQGDGIGDMNDADCVASPKSDSNSDLERSNASNATSDPAEGSSSRRRAIPARIKNRRFAHMQRLDRSGFFDEQAIRERCPEIVELFLGGKATDKLRRVSLSAASAEGEGDRREGETNARRSKMEDEDDDEDEESEIEYESDSDMVDGGRTANATAKLGGFPLPSNQQPQTPEERAELDDLQCRLREVRTIVAEADTPRAPWFQKYSRKKEMLRIAERLEREDKVRRDAASSIPQNDGSDGLSKGMAKLNMNGNTDTSSATTSSVANAQSGAPDSHTGALPGDTDSGQQHESDEVKAANTRPGLWGNQTTEDLALLLDPDERDRFGWKRVEPSGSPSPGVVPSDGVSPSPDGAADSGSPPASHHSGKAAAASFHSHRVYRVHELQRYMRERFLHGEEAGIDYARIDRDDSVDDYEMLDQDAEDAYFS